MGPPPLNGLAGTSSAPSLPPLRKEVPLRSEPSYAPIRVLARVELSGVQPPVLGSEEAEMQIAGVDLHARLQTISMLDTHVGQMVEKTLEYPGDAVQEFTLGWRGRSG
jgi:hypothetical protein